MKHKSIYLFFLLILSSCYTYEPQFEGPFDPSSESVDQELSKTLMYTSSGKLYLSNDYGLETVQVSDDDVFVQYASINNNHTKVIYKVNGEDIAVYDIESQTIERRVENSRDAVFCDFHANNESIYYFTSKGMMYVDGTQLYNTNPLDMTEHLTVSSSSSYNFGSAVILPNNDIIASFKFFFGNSRYIARINETEQIKSRQLTHSSGPLYNNLEHMRINHTGTLLHASEVVVGGIRSMEIDINTLEVETNSKNYSLPHSYLSQEVGYFIYDDNTLVIPEGDDQFILNSSPSSLDY